MTKNNKRSPDYLKIVSVEYTGELLVSAIFKEKISTAADSWLITVSVPATGGGRNNGKKLQQLL